MTPEEQDNARADDDGMLPATRRRIARGTPVRSTMTHPATGLVVGHDPDLDLPLIEWADGNTPEACEDSEFEVIS